LNSLIFHIKCFLFGVGQNFNQFSWSIFQYFKWLIQNGNPKLQLLDSITLVISSRFHNLGSTSRFHNLSNGIPILTWDTSMNLWLNSLMSLWLNYLMVFTKIFLLKEGQNFTPFSCSIFPNFRCGPEWGPKIALLNSITWVVGSRFPCEMPLRVCG